MLGLWLSLVGCGLLGAEQRMDQRVLEMRDHEIDAFDALLALQNRNVDDAREAGKRLAASDAVPGLPEPAVAMLDAVRHEGAVLSSAEDAAEAAASVARMAQRCGDCHAYLEVRPLGAERKMPLEEAFFAVAFREDRRWERAQTGLASIGAREATTWPERSVVLAEALERQVTEVQ